MKAFLASIVLSLLIIGCRPSQTPEKNVLINHLGHSTVALIYNDGDDTDDEVNPIKPYCSGVWVDQTHILTAFHCLKNIGDMTERAVLGLIIYISTWREMPEMGQKPLRWHLTKVVAVDGLHDLGLLELVGQAIPAHEWAGVGQFKPELLSEVYIVGHVHGFYWTFLKGWVAGYRENIPHVDKAGEWMQLEAPINHGNSGGGAFNEKGELVGIASFMMSMPDSGGFVGLENIRKFLGLKKLK
jgi:S1-C subfamily serine protease